jgi:hypothetical protein
MTRSPGAGHRRPFYPTDRRSGTAFKAVGKLKPTPRHAEQEHSVVDVRCRPRQL